jgi:Lipid A core - O-antigen ligase and related enzymes
VNDYLLHLLVLLITIVISVIPLIVRLKVVAAGYDTPVFWNNDQNADFFTYYKSLFLLICSTAIFTLLIVNVINKGIQIKLLFAYIPLSIYVFLVVLSSILSKHNHVALFGFIDRSEGMYVILSYFILFITSSLLVDRLSNIRFIFGGIVISACLIALIGIFQFFGFDFFKSNLGINIILPAEYGYYRDAIKYPTDAYLHFKNAIYSTLYNSNSLGSYISMIFPLSLTWFILVRKKVYKLFCGLFCCLLLSNLIGTGSRGAFSAVLISVGLMIFLLKNQIKENWKSLLILISSFIVIFLGLNIQSDGKLVSRVESTLDSKGEKVANTSIDKIKDFKIDNNELTLMCSYSSLFVRIVGNDILFYDDKENSLDLTSIEEGKKFSFKNPRYSDYIISNSGEFLRFQKGNSSLYFSAKGNTFKALDTKGQEISIVPINKVDLKGYERFASSRGYIWSRTLPLLKDTILLGHGPDNFVYNFPQNDYKGKLNYMFDAYIIIDKPHNLYLQVGVNTGVLSLISLLVLFINYLISTLRLVLKTDFNDNYSIFSYSILFAITGYLLAGIFTDSMVGVAPVFWVLLGLGVGINNYVTDKR